MKTLRYVPTTHEVRVMWLSRMPYMTADERLLYVEGFEVWLKSVKEEK